MNLVWEPGFGGGGFSPLIDQSDSLCLYCLCKHYGLFWTPAFIMGIGIWVLAQQGVPIWSGPNERHDHWISEILWLETFHMCCQKSLLDKLSVSCVILLRKNSWKLALRFPQTLPLSFFSLLLVFCCNKL